MDDEEQESGITQIPLIHDNVFHDNVFDESLALRPLRKSPARKKIKYPPGYDPDTIDLFEDEHGESIIDGADPGLANDGAADTDDNNSDDLRASAGEILGGPMANPSDEIDQQLRTEIADNLVSILEDLNSTESKPDQND